MAMLLSISLIVAVSLLLMGSAFDPLLNPDAADRDPGLDADHIPEPLHAPQEPWDPSCANSPREQRIIFSMIVSDLTEPTDPTDHRRWVWAKEFDEEVFGGKRHTAKWPAIYTNACPNVVNSKDMIKGRGSNIAHREVWDSFYRHRRPCAEYHNDVMVIFEDDAYAAVPDAANRTIAAVKNMSADTDVLYLGYCFEPWMPMPWENGRCPFCLHAYVITLPAAEKLLRMVDPCGMFADAKIFNLWLKKKIKFELVERRIDPVHDKYFSQYMHDRDLHIGGDFQYGGLFAQCKYDTIKQVTEGTAAIAVGATAQVYYMWHGKWRPLESMAQFEALGLSADEIVRMTPHQLFRIPVSKAPTKDKLIAKIVQERAELEQQQQQQQQHMLLNLDCNITGARQTEAMG